MSGGGTQSTISQQTVPDWLKPFYTQALQPALNLAQGPGPLYYPGQQVAPLNPLQEQGIQSTVNTASGPNASQGAQAANQYETSGALINPQTNPYMQALNATGQQNSALPSSVNANNFMTSGALLNPSNNPFLHDTFTQGANAIQDQLSSEFAGSGRNIIGSLPIQSDEMNNLATQLYGGAYQQGLGQMGAAIGNTPGLTNAQYTPAQLYGNAYGQGLNTMTQASALAPSIDQGMYMPGQELLQIGGGLQGQTQNQINANQNMWNFQQQQPYNSLSWYSSLLGQNAQPFGGQQSTSTMPNNTAMTAGGGALAGAGTGAMMFPANPAIGALGGAAVGGLLGLFH